MASAPDANYCYVRRSLRTNVLSFSKIVARLALSQAPDRRESGRTPNPGKVVEAIHKLHSDHDRSLPQFVDDMVENVEMRGVFAIGEGVRHRFAPAVAASAGCAGGFVIRNGHEIESFRQRRGECLFDRTRVTVWPCNIAAAADRHRRLPGVMC
jgi:hypothetical protein